MAISQKQTTRIFDYITNAKRIRRLEKDCDILRTEDEFPLITNYCKELIYYSEANQNMRPTEGSLFFIISSENNSRSSKGKNAVYPDISKMISALEKEITDLKKWQGEVLDDSRNNQSDTAKILSPETLEAAEFLLRHWENLRDKLGQT